VQQQAYMIDAQVLPNLWGLADAGNFAEVLGVLTSHGVREDALGETLFACARQAIAESRLATGRRILEFLVAALEDEEEKTSLYKMIGDLHRMEGNHVGAREWYGRLAATRENIRLCLETFIADRDVAGLLEFRDRVLAGMTPEAQRVVHGLVDEVMMRIQEDPEVRACHAARFAANRDLHADTYFFSARDALEVARRQNRVQRTIAVTGLQICYYSEGELPEGTDLPNLIHVPFEQALDYFTTTRNRLPTSLVLPAGTTPEKAREAAALFSQCLRLARSRRNEFAAELARRASGLRPVARVGEPLRILAPASRLTTVMQHASRGLANAFRALGHEVTFIIEENDMEEMDSMWFFSAMCEINPHLIININHANNALLSPDLINVVWWQDPMPELLAGQRIPWRDRDLVFSLTRERYQGWLERTGLRPERYRVQPFCIDVQVFHPGNASERKERVVFVGSSARNVLNGTREESMALEALRHRLEGGEVLEGDQVNAIGARHGVPPEHMAELHHFLVRELCVEWLCQQDTVPVEIYGRFWESNPHVAPFFRGEIAHGEELADLYRQSRYALCCHYELLHHNRLAEIGACGAIPVVYDCRHRSEEPFWEEEVLYFRTRDELVRRLRERPPIRPERFAAHYDYRNFAARILAWAEDLGFLPQGYTSSIHPHNDAR